MSVQIQLQSSGVSCEGRIKKALAMTLMPKKPVLISHVLFMQRRKTKGGL